MQNSRNIVYSAVVVAALLLLLACATPANGARLGALATGPLDTIKCSDELVAAASLDKKRGAAQADPVKCIIRRGGATARPTATPAAGAAATAARPAAGATATTGPVPAATTGTAAATATTGSVPAATAGAAAARPAAH